MHKAEFSETQFSLAFFREYSFSFNPFILFMAPHTYYESKYASDIIIEHYDLKRKFKYSEFLQLKRSKFFDQEIFNDLKGLNVIDTSVTNMYGFNIYNSAKTEQFNVLQRLVRRPSTKVYYCAPLFYTISEFNNHFTSKTILANTKKFDVGQKLLQTCVIPHNSTHKIIFNSRKQYVCSDPVEIEGQFANDLNRIEEDQTSDFENEIIKLFSFVRENTVELNVQIEEDDMHFLGLRKLFLQHFNLYWVPHFESIN